MAKAKYIVGIDLGTTNIVLSYAPLAGAGGEEPAKISLLPIIQELAKGAVEKLDVLPSFIFERVKEKPVLAWEDDSQYIIGDYARERGAEVPDRLISSAKSWLCNTRIDRTSPVLPWNSPEENTKISPLQAMATFMRHVRHSWAEEFSKDKLEDQKVVVTIPASFDAAARDLIVEAARMAGLPAITLLEEPQAAFYSWISQNDSPWRQQVKKGDVVLVVDVGGGTSDFSLIEISEANGDLALERVAVGNHILLGGDNMDLTLAYVARRKLEESNKKISQWQTVQLSHQCRKAKELLLTDPGKDSVPIVISGRGSSVIGGAVKTSIERSDIEQTLLDGFFPACNMADDPVEDTSGGVREISLMYAADPAITRHLARFLRSQNSEDRQYGFPQAILFNGGVFRSEIFRNRLIEVINSWLEGAGKEKIKVLEGIELSQAVARGATYFGIAREGQGIRIRGGVSQAYYLGIESSLPAVPGFKPPLKALCVARQGTEEGTVLDVPGRTFGLVIGKKAEFRFYKSNCRREDEFAQMIEEIDETFEDTSALQVELPAYEGMQAGDLVDVGLQIAITEIGTLEVYCLARRGDHRWKLEFNVRDSMK
ncbi:MAG: Hsp70 family protein [Candidatus Riflebacteria bacterium]|nr:Hsp70 family protein [Candidatus Riflebacteria bacterium]